MLIVQSNGYRLMTSSLLPCTSLRRRMLTQLTCVSCRIIPLSCDSNRRPCWRLSATRMTERFNVFCWSLSSRHPWLLAVSPVFTHHAEPDWFHPGCVALCSLLTPTKFDQVHKCKSTQVFVSVHHRDDETMTSPAFCHNFLAL